MSVVCNFADAILAKADSQAVALVQDDCELTFADLYDASSRLAAGLLELGARRHDRIAIYLNKTSKCVISMIAAARIGCIFVPINQVLKPRQVEHILRDCRARILITSASRHARLTEALDLTSAVDTVVVTDGEAAADSRGHTRSWSHVSSATRILDIRALSTDPAAILYTSGSTGKPKGVVVSHSNLICGASSVIDYLALTPEDRILGLLPLSFDAGLSQLTTSLLVGARLVLLDYLYPQDVCRTCEQHGVTVITGVPPLWIQLAECQWSRSAAEHIRLFANTGGRLPHETLHRLREIFSNALPYLMYGLTEAFRSTYLDPGEIDRRPDSIGKPIPNVEIVVISDTGEPCQPEEPGELVHKGPLVTLGYWNDPKRTAEVFRPAPCSPQGLPGTELAVWSGDIVKMDEDGFLYFIGRRDELIKSSGYRVSPTEVEEIAYTTGLVREAVAFGVPDERLGQRIALVVSPVTSPLDGASLRNAFSQAAPSYLMPTMFLEWEGRLPRNANGKIDRQEVKRTFLRDGARL